MKEQSQRWTVKRKVELILAIIKGQTNLVEACREHDLRQSEVEGWVDTFMKSGERGLRVNSKDEKDQDDREIKELRAKVGELVLELDVRKKWEALSREQETTSCPPPFSFRLPARSTKQISRCQTTGTASRWKPPCLLSPFRS